MASHDAERGRTGNAAHGAGGGAERNGAADDEARQPAAGAPGARRAGRPHARRGGARAGDATLTRCAGNRTWAADLLGLAPLALREKLLEYRRTDEEVARTVARREATMMMDADTADEALRPTHIPPARFLA